MLGLDCKPLISRRLFAFLFIRQSERSRVSVGIVLRSNVLEPYLLYSKISFEEYPEDLVYCN